MKQMCVMWRPDDEEVISFNFRDTSDQDYLAISLNNKEQVKADKHLLFPACVYQCMCSVSFQFPAICRNSPTELGKPAARVLRGNNRRGTVYRRYHRLAYINPSQVNDDFTCVLCLFHNNFKLIKYLHYFEELLFQKSNNLIVNVDVTFCCKRY